MSDIYDVDYFIRKFEAIPENEVGCAGLMMQCANWHLGVRSYTSEAITPEVRALANIFIPFSPAGILGETIDEFERIYTVNDGMRGCRRLGNTPKARILNALKEVKEGAVK